MSTNMFKKMSNLFFRTTEMISQSYVHRVHLINAFNEEFKKAYNNSELCRFCYFSTVSGNLEFKHAFSSHYLRSGFQLTIDEDYFLTDNDFTLISTYVLENAEFVKKLMVIGYDTFIVKGKKSIEGIQIPLKEIVNLDLNY